MRKKIIFVGMVIVSIVLLTISLLAQEPESPSKQPLPEDFDYTDSAAVNSLKVEDLVTAIAEGKITDLSIVNDNQLAAALGNNPAAVLPKLSDSDLARALKSDLSLIDKSVEITKEVILRTGKDADLLNNNPEVKEKFFSTFAIVDKGGKINSIGPQEVIEAIARGEITDLGKVKVTTAGLPPEKSTTFTLGAVSGAELLADGSLRIKKTVIAGTEDFFIEEDEYGEKTLVMEKGLATVAGESPKMEVRNGKLRTAIAGEDVYSTHEGTFTLRKTTLTQFPGLEEGYLIQGEFSSYTEFTDRGRIITGSSPGVQVSGQIFVPEKRSEEVTSTDRFIILSGVKGTAITKRDGTKIVVNTKEGVYYTDRALRTAASFCNAGFSCIVNAPSSSFSENSGFRDRLAFLNVQNEDKIAVKTPVYYDHVEVLDQKNGEVIFTSYDKLSGRTNSKITVHAQGDVRTEGLMELTKSGRFDVMYEKCDKNGLECNKILHHWSSNRHQKVQAYFAKPREHFVTCTVGVDCERKFAENFGKIIPPGAAKASTTVIIAGENAYTAQTLYNHCKKYGGCYILNSRDAPPTTDSSHLVVTGHHGGAGYLYRDKTGENPMPIDKLYMSCETGTSPFSCLPKESAKNPVKTITFSACNTIAAAPEQSPMLSALSEAYKGAQSIQGSNGKAPLHEGINAIPTSEGELKKQAREYGNGKRAWYVKQKDGSWKFTDGKTEVKEEQEKPDAGEWV